MAEAHGRKLGSMAFDRHARIKIERWGREEVG